MKLNINLSNLRRVTNDDIELLFHWTNSTDVRENSFHSENILYKNHVIWFNNKLSSSTTIMYIYMYNNIPIGQIRFEIENECAEINYSVCHEYQGQGHGKHMLALAEVQIKADRPEIKKITAKVMPHNLASKSIFENSGYYHLYEKTID